MNGLGVAVDRLNAVGRAANLFTAAVVVPSVTGIMFAAEPAMMTSVRVREPPSSPVTVTGSQKAGPEETLSPVPGTMLYPASLYTPSAV